MDNPNNREHLTSTLGPRNTCRILRIDPFIRGLSLYRYVKLVWSQQGLKADYSLMTYVVLLLSDLTILSPLLLLPASQSNERR